VLTANCLLLTAYCLLLTAYCLLLTVSSVFFSRRLVANMPDGDCGFWSLAPAASVGSLGQANRHPLIGQSPLPLLASGSWLLASHPIRSREVKFAAKLGAHSVEYNYHKYQGHEAGTGQIQQPNNSVPPSASRPTKPSWSRKHLSGC
jgi:hypothetical protein